MRLFCKPPSVPSLKLWQRVGRPLLTKKGCAGNQVLSPVKRGVAGRSRPGGGRAWGQIPLCGSPLGTVAARGPPLASDGGAGPPWETDGAGGGHGPRGIQGGHGVVRTPAGRLSWLQPWSRNRGRGSHPWWGAYGRTNRCWTQIKTHPLKSMNIPSGEDF